MKKIRIAKYVGNIKCLGKILESSTIPMEIHVIFGIIMFAVIGLGLDQNGIIGWEPFVIIGMAICFVLLMIDAIRWFIRS